LSSSSVRDAGSAKANCSFSKIKHFRRVATRYDKTIPAFLAFVAIACFMVWLR
jgi:transposase